MKLSAENIRRALAGEVVEVQLHTEVKVDKPIVKWVKDMLNGITCADRIAILMSVIEV